MQASIQTYELIKPESSQLPGLISFSDEVLLSLAQQPGHRLTDIRW